VTALEFRDVSRRFGDVEVLRGVNFSVNRGDFMAITGPSGSGKSTMLHLAALLDAPTAGQIFLEEENISAAGSEQQTELRKRKIGMIFQRANLLTRRSALANVAFRFRYTGESDKYALESARRALDEVGLAGIADRTARVLSGGEMQRVAIARAIALQPALLLADEPTGNLDRASAKSVMETLARLNRSGITILLVTHNEELLPYCSRHCSLHDGILREVKS
jgi:putative ABC transport system ATP-binding protein